MKEKKEIAYTIGRGILTLLAFGTLATMVLVAPNALQIIKLFLDKEPRLKKYSSDSIRNSLYRLQSQKLISIEEEKGKIIVRITKRGKIKAFKYKIDEMKIPIPKTWDGKWRVVIFDIPNKKTLARDVLREKLKSLGFWKIQKSVFVYPYECREQIDYIREVYQVSSNVKTFVVEQIEDEKRYLEFFNLKQLAGKK